MEKIVTLKLLEIRYSGESVGDDIRIEVDALNNLLAFNKKVKHGSAVILNKEVGQQVFDQSSLRIPVKIKVTERDAVFNDEGSIEENLSVDLSKTATQKSTYQVKVKESRGIFGGKTGIFDLGFEVVVTEVVQYVRDIARGWLLVELEKDSKKISLPAYLKVQLYKKNAKREYFTIMEGLEGGKKSSVKLQDDGSSYLATGNPYTDAVYMKYSISKKTLEIGGRKYATTDDPDAPWKKDMYDVEIPDAPHRFGRAYVAKHALSWFRVGHSGDRYIHTGSHSLGCITVIEKDKWEEIYGVLIKARKGDSASVGTLEVID